MVRAAAFPDREFEGSVSSIAPLIEPGRLEPPGSRDQADWMSFGSWSD